ncbi:hypothetical protein [Bosea sp. Root483D1]|uniref:hypothetical protein n=1 Tax=Bosea sp. Root483D1 TaxID=1736544 RepID=UPI0012E33C70|nr:hypothetical protein [Bosea sp. Root483D1]
MNVDHAPAATVSLPKPITIWSIDGALFQRAAAIAARDLFMIDLFHRNSRTLTASAFRHGAAVALLAGAALFGAGQAPALAQSTSWEEGCAMRVVTPGSGDILRTMNCARQKECQQMANAKGSTMMGLGCFGVAPQAQAPVARQAGRTRPAQQQ